MAAEERNFTLGEAITVTGKSSEFFTDEIRAKLTAKGAVIKKRGRGTRIPVSALEAIGLTVDTSKLSSVEVGSGSANVLARQIKQAEARISKAEEVIKKERVFIQKATVEMKRQLRAEFTTAKKVQALKEKAEALLAEAEQLEQSSVSAE